MAGSVAGKPGWGQGRQVKAEIAGSFPAIFNHFFTAQISHRFCPDISSAQLPHKPTNAAQNHT
jgi:hypothetical protein